MSYKVALQLNPTDLASQDLLEEARRALLSSGETLEAIEALEVMESPRPSWHDLALPHTFGGGVNVAGIFNAHSQRP